MRIARTNDGNWKASLDGRPIATVAVDLSLIGVEIPAGTHRVELRYEDPVLRISIWVSAAAVLIAILSGAAARRRRR